MNCFDLSHNLVSNGLNFMKFILSIYDRDVMIHVTILEDVISFKGVMALNINEFVLSEP